MTRSLRLLAAGALTLAALGASAAPALASKTQESIFQDDGLLGGTNLGAQTGAMSQLSQLGVKTVRVLVHWTDLAPSPHSSRVPHVNLSSPSAYRGWERFDHIARLGQMLGIRVSLDLVGGVPNWAQTGICRSTNAVVRSECTPSPGRFHQLAVAAGIRYSGSYPDGNGGTLPRIGSWQVWNEPNQSGWLSPQLKRTSRGVILASPLLYRRLALAEISALYATGHGADRILVADTAPLGASYGRPGDLSRKNTAPAEFLDAVFCLDSHLHRLRGTAARQQGCTGRIQKLRVTGFSHHPYEQGGGFSPTHAVKSDEITINHANRLERLLDAAARNGAITGPRLPIYYTEYGFQTNPPDQLLGLPLNEQALFINESDWIAFNDPRIMGVAQYALADDASISGFNTGLEFNDGRRKPSYDAYRLPIYVVKHRGGVLVWGEVRPGDHTQLQSVAIQTRSGRTWTTQATAQTADFNGAPNAGGFFEKKLNGVAPAYRVMWVAPDGTTFTSRSAQAAAH